MPFGQVADHLLERVRFARACVQAKRECAAYAFGIEVEADDAASRCFQKLRGNLPDEPQADDAGAVAELRRSAANSLKRDGADGRGCGVLQIAAGRDAADEIPGNAHVFGVIRLPRAGRSHQIPWTEISDPVADADDLARDRVADGPPLRISIRRSRRGGACVSASRRSGQPRQAPFGDLREAARSLAGIAQTCAEIVSDEPCPFEVTLDRRHVWCRDARRPQRRDLGADADQRVP